MEEHNQQQSTAGGGGELREMIRDVIQEYVSASHRSSEPAYKTELVEERRRREQLERRVNELVQENSRSRRAAEEAEKQTAIREGLQRLGVSKIDLGFRAVKDDIFRSEDGRLMARTGEGEVEMQDYLTKFAADNPELLPARIAGGSGASSPGGKHYSPRVDIDRIRPGMDPEELALVRREIAEAMAKRG